MTDYDALYRRLWQEVQKHEGRLEGGLTAFVERFIAAVKADGWQLGPDADAELTTYLSGVDNAIKSGITAALTVANGSNVMRSAAVLKMAEDAFSQRWPDGLRLSDRLWVWKKEMRAGITKELQAGVKLGQSVSSTVYAMQRAIERGGAPMPDNVFVDWEGMIEDLASAGRALIHNPAARADWQKAISQANNYIQQLKSTGTKGAAQRALDQIAKAVHAGREDLIGNALKWWGYDKQLYLLKRIARTEMATAAHRAVIASAIDDETVIGFQWRLSSSHPEPDICDYYAGIDMGLGKGVWTKEAVPQHKAHPHCMCLLIPRVTRIKTPGSQNYAEFIRGVSPDRQKQLLPDWAQKALKSGANLADLIRPDGLGLVKFSDFQKTA